MRDEKWEGIMRFFSKIWSAPEVLDKLPEKSLLLSLSEEEITKIFTKKRLELVRVIKEKHPISISALAKLVKRDLTAVERDLKILEGFGVVKLEKEGKIVKPSVEKELLILPLVPIKPFTIKDLEKHAAEEAEV
ncbi:MAG: HTH domain-containing protein [Candidatus Hydrothermarchaeota archaeon]|nr:HTH domain-containing protein [Candidatus Hydrothermarchaeota archaeon]